MELAPTVAMAGWSRMEWCSTVTAGEGGGRCNGGRIRMEREEVDDIMGPLVSESERGEER